MKKNLNTALNKGAASGSFYFRGRPISMSIRRASDDKVIKVDLSTEEGVKAAADFCKDTHGFVANFHPCNHTFKSKNWIK
jgi:hypothetical protein